MVSTTDVQGIPEGWLGAVEQARILGMHPDSLLRKLRYGELPEGSYRRVGRAWFFNPRILRNETIAGRDGK